MLNVPRCAFEIAQFSFDGVTVGEKPSTWPELPADSEYNQCKGWIKNPDDPILEQTVMYEFGTDACNVESTLNETHFTFDGMLNGQNGAANDVISRINKVEVPFSCVLSRDVTVTVENHFKPLVSNVEVELDTVESVFNVEMSLFSDRNLTFALDSNHSVNVPEPIFVKLEIENVQSLNLQVKRCWATPNDATDNEIQYVFIDEFCGIQEEITEDTLEIFGNGLESKAEFRINSFAFVSSATEPADDAEVYMHCEVKICDASIDPNACMTPCGSSRRRRSVDQSEATLVKVGPISVHKPSFQSYP